MLANKFIDLLEAEKLLDPEMIEELRRQVSQSGNRLPVETLAKLLVENEQLTKFQATRLVSRVKEERDKPATSAPVADDLAIEESEDNLALADEEIIEDVEVIEEAEEVDEVEVLDDGNDVIVAEVLDGDQPAMAQVVGAGSPALLKPRSTTRSKSIEAPPSRWETFRTYGAFGVFLFVVVMFGFLTMWFMRGSAEGALDYAKQAYESQDYKSAIKRYEDFASGFPAHKDVSFARCRIALSKVREVTENSSDVFEATKVSQQLLPTILDEPQLTDVRPDLAGALLNIGRKYVNKAENAKSNDERKKFVDGLSAQMEMIQDPKYIASQERKQNEPIINQLEESRQRLRRDVERAEDRTAAHAAMVAAIEQKNPSDVYSVRQKLVRRYPQLQADEELNKLLVDATQLVQGRVESSGAMPKTVEMETAADVGKRVMLASSAGSPIQLSEDRILYVKAKQSLYGIKASTGEVLWRVYLGSRDLVEPIEIRDNAVTEGNSDCLIVLSERGLVSRLAGTTGAYRWTLGFEGRVLDASVTREGLFVTCADGRVSSVDAESGQIKWSKQLPQALTSGVSVGTSKKGMFIPGESSNLYVLSKRDGSCSSVTYLGHEPGTISVAPVVVLQRLLVFENIGPGMSQVRTLAFDTEETQATTSQEPIRMRGHVVVPPQIEGRRVVVVTDLGEVAVFEIETVAGEQQLVRMAELVASENRPKIAWPLVQGNDLWVASTQLSKYQIQAARQEVIRDWVREDADIFTGRPIAIDDYLVHARNVRGTEGVRVSATNKKTGDPLWEVTLGVPVVGLVKKGNTFHAITSQGALYAITSANIGNGKIDGPEANPGRNSRQMSFNRVAVKGDQLVAVNAERGNQIAYYSASAPDDKALVVLSLATGEGKPSGDPIWIEGGVVIPMDNGQLIAVDPSSGQTLGAPIQPAMESGSKVSWATPALAGDGRTVLAADSNKQLSRIATGNQFSVLTDVPTANSVAGDLTCVAESVMVPTVGEQSSFVETYSVVDLTRNEALAIEGRISWGMHTMDNMALGYSNILGLFAVDASGKQLWVAQLPGVSPVGKPQLVEGEILLATVEGTLYRVNPQSGEITGMLRTGEAISSTPLVAGAGILIPGAEGNVLATNLKQFVVYEPSTATAPAE